jgi:hypothetical protein
MPRLASSVASSSTAAPPSLIVYPGNDRMNCSWSLSSHRTPCDGCSPLAMSTRRYCPAAMSASPTCRALITELHAFLTSMTGQSSPSPAATMWLVAGSMRSWLALANSSRSTGPGDSARAMRAAAIARSEACQPSGRTCTVSTPVIRWMSPVASLSLGLRSRSVASVCEVARTDSGR